MGISAEVAYLFRHAVIRDAAYGLHTPSARAGLHAMALEIMRVMPEGQSDAWAEELADHARNALGAADADRQALLVAELGFLLRAAEHDSRHWQNDGAVSLRLRIADHPLAESRQRTDALLEAVATLVRSGRPNQAPELLDRALEIAQAGDDREAVAQALAARCQALSILGDAAGAEQANAAALKAAHELRDPELEARVQITLAQIAQARGDWATSERAAQRAMELLSAAPASQSYARSLLFIGDSCWQQGKLKEAEQHFRAALQVYMDTRHLGGEASARDHLGSLLQEMGRGEEGTAEHERAVAIYSDIGDTLGYGSAISNLASAMMVGGRLVESRRHRLKALELFRAAGASYLEGVGLGNLATIERRMGLLESSLQRFQLAVAVLRRAGRAVEQAVFDAMFGQLLLLLGFSDAAAANASQAGNELTRLGTVKWREQYAGLLEVRVMVDRAAQGNENAGREARDRLALMRDSCGGEAGALAQVIATCEALVAEAGKPQPLLFRGHLVSELEPVLRLALMARASTLDPDSQRQLDARPALLAAMRESTQGMAMPDWAAEDVAQ